MRRRSCGWRAAALICTCALAEHCHGAWSRLEGSLNALLQINYPRGLTEGYEGGEGGARAGRALAGAEKAEEEEEEVGARCALTSGTWCRDYLLQKPIPTKAPPHGNRSCLNNCNGLAGVCNHDTGLCHCIAGWQGDYCEERQTRPCTNRTREVGWEVLSQASPDDKGWTASRCSGVCDDDRAICYCDGKYGRQAAPTFRPAGTPPVQQGRPMPLECMPKENSKGEDMGWSSGPSWDDVHGPEGWCQADKPKHRCPCMIDGVAGDYCDIPTEHFCLNQCTGHGDCIFGFCRCHPGYYGHDCARRAQGFPEVPGDQEKRPWLQDVIVVPQGIQDPPPVTQRLRPLIYVYDLPPLYNVRMLEYRVFSGACANRRWAAGNRTEIPHGTYLIEQLLHEALLQSEHRTLDPEEADYFYVPVYASCFAHPVHGWADHPWFPGPANRVMQMAMMTLEAKRWIENHLPWWERRGGADHIWLFSHDEGACWAPHEIYQSSVILTHWGRKDLNPVSNTAFYPDNYTIEQKTYWQPGGYKHIIGGHPCYDPKKNHLVVPAVKSGGILQMSPLLGYRPLPRTILMSFRGDFRDKKEGKTEYGRGIRARVRRFAAEGDWWAKYNITVENGVGPPFNYGELLMRSIFCLVAPGDGWSPRVEDAVLHGCIPVLVMDHVDPIFAGLLDWSAFSIRIREDDLDRIPDILTAIPEQRRTAMLEAVGKVWKRFMYNSVKSIWLEVKNKVTADLGPGIIVSDPQSAPSNTSPNAGALPKTMIPEPKIALPQQPGGHDPHSDGVLRSRGPPDTEDSEDRVDSPGSSGSLGSARDGDKGAQGANAVSLGTAGGEHRPAGGKDRTTVRIVARLNSGSLMELPKLVRELGVEEESVGEHEEEEEEEEERGTGNWLKVPQVGAPEFTWEELADWLNRRKPEQAGAGSGKTYDGKTGKTSGKTKVDREYLRVGDVHGNGDEAQRGESKKRRRQVRQRRKGTEASAHARLAELASGGEAEGEVSGEAGEVEEEAGGGRRELLATVDSAMGMSNLAAAEETGHERIAKPFISKIPVRGMQLSSSEDINTNYHRTFINPSPPNTYRGDLRQDDAMATIMAWLYERIPATRGP